MANLLTNFLTYNLLTIASFRMGVPLILFFVNFCPLCLFEKHKHFHRITNFGSPNKKLNIQTEFMHQMIFDWSVKVEQEMTLFISGLFSVVTCKYIHCVAKVYAVLPFYDVKCLCSGGRKATPTKGQLISKCLFEKIVWSKIPTKNLIDSAQQVYSRVHKSWNSFFSKILEKASIVQKKMIPHRNWLDFSMR